MDKVRFSCPRCQTVMQTGVEKVGFDVACPHCAHRFRLVESETPAASARASFQNDATLPPSGTGPNVGTGGRIGDTTHQHVSDSTKPIPTGGLPGGGMHQAKIEPVQRVVPATGFVCPYCNTQIPPSVKSEVSTVGWVVFTVLLLTTCVLCFFGLMIRDKYRICSQCKIRLG